MWRDRKVRLAIVLGLAVLGLYVAWRMQEDARCAPGRHEVKDAAGTVVRIERRSC